ncbi:MAG: hypothetical protein WB792_00225 [Desulfobacterales bacterium]
MKRGILLFMTLFLLIVFSGCSPFDYENDYKGKIIDADTGKPIEGVVVLGIWFKSYISPAGSSEKFYDAREVVTDNNGEFSVPGMGLLIFSNIVEPMDVLIFKAGYEYLGVWSWRPFVENSIPNKNIKWKDNMAIIPLKKLTMKERKKIGDPHPSLPGRIPDAKIKLMLKEINKDRRERGLQTYPER